MDIAVLSDIHGNYLALQRCMEYTLERGIRKFLFLGDYLGELAFPQRTMHMLYDISRRYECHFVRGNKEEYWLSHRENEADDWKDCDSTTGSLFYTYSHLNARDFTFFEEMPLVQKIVCAGMPQLTICHGSPERVNEKMLPGKTRTYEMLVRDESAMILCGHTHVPERIVHEKKLVLNPGSVGMAKGCCAQFLILHGAGGSWREEFVCLPYDTKRVIEELYAEQLNIHAPGWCAVSEHLLTCEDAAHAHWHGDVLTRAMKLCETAEGKCVWPKVPEKYWSLAVQEMLG